MDILYYGAGWPTNIGNAFLDLGAMAILRAAAPGARVGYASEMPRWFFEQPVPEAPRSGLLARVEGWPAPRRGPGENALDVAAVTRCDLVAFVGMAMCEEFVRVNGPAIRSLARRGVPVLLLATGAESYDDAERRLYSDFLAEVKPVAFISRDDASFEMFARAVPRSYRGVDCGFFVSDAYQPFGLDLPPYVALNFDAQEAPPIDAGGRLVVRSHHECWGPIAERRRTPQTLISDIPHDYLTLYANAEEVHSDRVHACVATLAYGRRARLYHPTPRGSLFGPVGAEGIREGLVSLDLEELRAKKQNQIDLVREIIEEHVATRSEEP